MEKQVIYGVFAIDVELQKVTDRKKELKDLAVKMASLSYTMQQRGRFVRAYKRLEDAVTECYEANGSLIERILDVPDGVTNGNMMTYLYPKTIEVNV